MNAALASRVYDVLVKHCGARDGEYDRADFMHAHRDGAEYPCREYRFIGSLGFGGKFWSDYMTVSCYREDETTERLAAIESANIALAEMAAIA